MGEWRDPVKVTKLAPALLHRERRGGTGGRRGTSKDCIPAVRLQGCRGADKPSVLGGEEEGSESGHGMRGRESEPTKRAGDGRSCYYVLQAE